MNNYHGMACAAILFMLPFPVICYVRMLEVIGVYHILFESLEENGILLETHRSCFFKALVCKYVLLNFVTRFSQSHSNASQLFHTQTLQL